MCRVSRPALLALLLGGLALACTEAETVGGTRDAAVVGDDLDAFVPPDQPDFGRPDTGGTPRGEFGDPCDDGTDCLSGFCIESAFGGRICTRRCAESCPDGYECNLIENGEADRLFLCTADQPDLCKPCTNDRECDDNGDLCIQIGLSTYCAEDCSDDGLCPDGYECADIGDGTDGGVRARQCVPADGAGCLPCDDADGDGFGDGGDCRGFDCDDDDPNVYEGAVELCDGKDNNCNSLVDEAVNLEAPPADITCFDEGVCRGARVECTRGEWACNYPDSFEFGGELSCDGLDNDCDGERDEDIDLTSDPQNCAFCGNACSFQNAQGLCVDSSCELGDCAAGWFNVDGNDGNGCEYACNRTREGVEACDSIDNDCDGDTDEGFDLQADPSHCGGCGRVCEVENATPACTAGACAVERCDPGWVDLDGDARNGCEFACEPSNEGEEICDTVDNDCDGAADENFDLRFGLDHCGACNRECAFTRGIANCNEGVCELTECEPGWWNADGDLGNGCEYACVLSRDGVEACDLVDNDCDTLVDEGFDLAADPTNCGACGRVCLFANAVPLCQAGECALGECAPGFWNVDGGDQNGCEYRCDGAADAPELCNQADDDCDGQIDEDFDLFVSTDHCGRCNNACVLPNAVPRCDVGACAVAECQGGFHDIDGRADNGCEYACQPTNGGVEVCDNVDNDCNGQIDDQVNTNDDPSNCGGCGRSCQYQNGVPACEAGQCRMVDCAPGFVDLDGSDANGCEYACVVVAGPDVPDADGRDSNCDGIDGDLERAIFVRRDGDDRLGGVTPDAAVATFARALAIARGRPERDQILIATGVYRSDSTLAPEVLPGGVGLYGGYVPSFAQRTGDPATLQVTAYRGVLVQNLAGPLVFDQVDVEVT
ncbi:MAG: putative metal-binding motif-containing protein, partial [Myxococcales bacterium]|nr:putative metal-binding motif-containing protein [Myxococcales bacterium]